MKLSILSLAFLCLSLKTTFAQSSQLEVADYVRINASGWSFIHYAQNSTDRFRFAYNPYENKFLFQRSYQGWYSALSIDRFNGNVGIGTTEPGTYKLAVEGKVGAREVEVRTGSWADFVFAPDYKLPSLGDVQRYIDQHGHLPDIPSEAEVIENGVPLGEMQKLLLQKIEELTLYTLDFQKQLQAQQEQIEKLKARLEE